MLVHILIFRNSESDLTKRTVSAFSGCASQWKGLMGNAGSAWRSWEGQGSGQGQGGSGVGFPGPCLHVGPAGMDTSLLALGQWGTNGLRISLQKGTADKTARTPKLPWSLLSVLNFCPIPLAKHGHVASRQQGRLGNVV